MAALLVLTVDTPLPILDSVLLLPYWPLFWQLPCISKPSLIMKCCFISFSWSTPLCGSLLPWLMLWVWPMQPWLAIVVAVSQILRATRTFMVNLFAFRFETSSDYFNHLNFRCFYRDWLWHDRYCHFGLVCFISLRWESNGWWRGGQTARYQKVCDRCECASTTSIHNCNYNRRIRSSFLVSLIVEKFVSCFQVFLSSFSVDWVYLVWWRMKVKRRYFWAEFRVHYEWLYCSFMLFVYLFGMLIFIRFSGDFEVNSDVIFITAVCEQCCYLEMCLNNNKTILISI